MVREADHRFQVRASGSAYHLPDLSSASNRIEAWLDDELRRGWAMTAAGLRGVVDDALGIYFLDATLASAFVARWHAGYKV